MTPLRVASTTTCGTQHAGKGAPPTKSWSSTSSSDFYTGCHISSWPRTLRSQGRSAPGPVRRTPHDAGHRHSRAILHRRGNRDHPTHQGDRATEVDDGVAFDGASLRTAPICEDGRYHGLRLVMPASIARAQLKLRLDVSLGDPITPEPQLIAYQQPLDAGTSLFSAIHSPPSSPRSCPPLSNSATSTAATATTAITIACYVQHPPRRRSIHRSRSHGNVPTDHLATTQLEHLRSPPATTALLLRMATTSSASRYRLPTRFADAVAVVTAFADPLISGEARGKDWDPENARWT